MVINRKQIDTASVLEKINRASLKFLMPLAPEEAYSTVVEEAIKLVDAEYGSIFLLNKRKLERAYSSLPLLYSIKPRRGSDFYKAFKSNKSLVLNIEGIAKVHPKIKEMGIKSIVVIPLSYRNRSVGVLVLESLRAEYFTQKELGILNLFGSLASLAIRKTQLYAEAKQALEQRDLFISLAAHEFRTPLTTITVYAQLLKKRLKKTKNSSLSRWINDLSLEALRLNKLVSEFLAANRVKSGTLLYSWKMCSLREVLARALASFASIHPGREIFFQDTLEGYDTIIGDFDKLLQVFINLLDNAAKFSSKASKITVKLYKKQPHYIVEVKDLG